MEFVRRHPLVLLIIVVLSAPLLAQFRGSSSPETMSEGSFADAVSSAASRVESGMAWIPAGQFLMGSTASNRRDEWPVHKVATDGYWLDVGPVMNVDFARFVQDTGHITTAERRGSSLVFDLADKAWHQVGGATWQTPSGPESSIVGRDRHPVVHVSWHDAVAYAKWADKRLPTEAELERAARGGLLGKTYAWGDNLAPDNRPMANFWQGRFPHDDRGLDRFHELSPVGRFPANRYGLVDIAGNAWCWVADVYDAEFYQTAPTENPLGDSATGERVMRGGSYLTPASSLTVATRGHADPEHTSCDVGFRCAR